ncbi:hypothetical protein EWM64_g2606 [Hericium alpestre]|uniref:Enoyl reductase (ER) domain-containing protein n=1 Tax=Hericium alpestre TaxID=135208 RepID=A0A4Z0A4R5_9AGAM|nr:hypothetical protein EWM64_g2606 [Hericium alpestre]
MLRFLIPPRPLVAPARLSQLRSHLAKRAQFSIMSYPKTSKAVGIQKTGGVEVIEDLELPFPEVKPDHLLIKVQWGGVNFIDTYLRSGLYPTPFLPLPIAMEIAGVIVELPTDASVLNNPQYQKRGFKKGGSVAINVIGSLKEYLSAPWDVVYPVPDGISMRTAAASVLQGLTALTLLTESHNVQKGETVLIHTVAGGVGLLMAQIAKARAHALVVPLIRGAPGDVTLVPDVRAAEDELVLCEDEDAGDAIAALVDEREGLGRECSPAVARHGELDDEEQDLGGEVE